MQKLRKKTTPSSRGSLEHVRNLLANLDASTVFNAAKTYSADAYKALADVLEGRAGRPDEDAVKELFLTALQYCVSVSRKAAKRL